MGFLKQNWKKILLAMPVLVILIFVIQKTDMLTDLKCPDDKSSEEKIADFDKWTKDFYDKSPDATYADLSDARKQFYIDNNCYEALKRVEDWKAGNVDPETIGLIERVMDEEFTIEVEPR